MYAPFVQLNCLGCACCRLPGEVVNLFTEFGITADTSGAPGDLEALQAVETCNVDKMQDVSRRFLGILDAFSDGKVLKQGDFWVVSDV